MATEPRSYVTSFPARDADGNRPVGTKAKVPVPVDLKGLAPREPPSAIRPQLADPPAVITLQQVRGNAFVGRLIGAMGEKRAKGIQAVLRSPQLSLQRLGQAGQDQIQRTVFPDTRTICATAEPEQIWDLQRGGSLRLSDERTVILPRIADDAFSVDRVPVVTPVQRETPEDTSPKTDKNTQDALSKRVQKLEVRAAELRSQLKKKPSFTAEQELEKLYKKYPMKVLEKMAATDPWAEKVYHARWAEKTKGDAAADKKTPNLPHTLEVVVTDEKGKLVSRDVFTSGDVPKKPRSKQEQLQAGLESHTEQKALKHVQLKRGQTMIMYGSYPPCTGGQVATRSSSRRRTAPGEPSSMSGQGGHPCLAIKGYVASAIRRPHPCPPHP